MSSADSVMPVEHQRIDPSLFVAALPVGLVALCVWLGVRIFNRREKWAIGIAGGVAMSLGYWGTYRALLEGKVYILVGVEPATGQNIFEIAPRYRLENALVLSLVSPAHAFDRLVRDEYWTTVEKSNGAKWRNPPIREEIRAEG